MAGATSGTEVRSGAVVLDIAVAEQRLVERRQRREDLILAIETARARRRRRARVV